MSKNLAFVGMSPQEAQAYFDAWDELTFKEMDKKRKESQHEQKENKMVAEYLGNKPNNA